MVVGAIVATIAADLLGDRNIWSAAVFSACNAGEAVLVASLIEWVFASPFKLDGEPCDGLGSCCDYRTGSLRDWWHVGLSLVPRVRQHLH